MIGFFRSCDGLLDRSAAELAALADAVRLVRYEAGHVWFADPAEERGQPVRWIVQGAVLLRPLGEVDPLGIPVVGPGACVGLASVAGWAGRGTSSPYAGYTAECHEPVWVAELPLDRYALLAEVPELADHLVALHNASAWRGRVAGALRVHPELAAWPAIVLARLARCAVLDAGGALRAVGPAAGYDDVTVPVGADRTLRVPGSCIDWAARTEPRLARRADRPVLTAIVAAPAVGRQLADVPELVAGLARSLRAQGDEVECVQLRRGASSAEVARSLAAAVVGQGYRHILVDGSSVGLSAPALLAAVEGLDCAAQVSYIVDHPSDWWDRPEAEGATAVPILPVARLGTPVGVAGDRVDRKLGALAQRLGAPGPQPWPLHAVRIRDDVDRWARAVGHRRVGVAIGGAGVNAIAAVPFLVALLDAGVPIDAIAGTSTGAFVGAFYGVGGRAGLDRLVASGWRIALGVYAAYWTVGDLLGWGLVRGLRYADLGDLEVPTIAAATRATTGEAVYLVSGLAGWACLASGSLPPMTPTYIGGERLYDGAAGHDLPASILPAAGCDVIVAVQAAPPVRRRSEASTGGDPWVELVRRVRPFRRLRDYARSYAMTVRQAAIGHASVADVVYQPTTAGAHAGSFRNTAHVAETAAGSEALGVAVAATVAAWRSRTPQPRRNHSSTGERRVASQNR